MLDEGLSGVRWRGMLPAFHMTWSFHAAHVAGWPIVVAVLRVVNAADGDVIAIVGVFMSAILSRHREFFHSQSNRTELSMWLCCCCRCHRWIKIH